MHAIIFYVTKNGESPVLDYMRGLAKEGNKDSRIKLNKIREYVKALEINGTYLPESYCKHIDWEIWELRPSSNRVLFAGWKDGAFVLLHTFAKKTQKTPAREIKKAKREFADFAERWDENEL